MPLKLGKGKGSSKASTKATSTRKKTTTSATRKKTTRRRREEEEVEDPEETEEEEEDPGLDEEGSDEDESEEDPDDVSEETDEEEDEESNDESNDEEEEEEEEEEPVRRRGSPKAASTKSGKGSFLRRGKAAREAHEKERARQTQREQDGRGSWRFWMGAGEERTLIFLDGNLDEDDMLDIPYVYEHNVPYEGRFKDIRCVAQNEDAEGRTEPCPVCESGHTPAYVGFMTVLELLEEPYKDKEGKKHYYRKRLYPVKIKTGDLLQKRALKLKEKEGTNGLTGWVVEVSRSNKQSARVGDYFDFDKHLTKKQIVAFIKKKGGDPKDAEPCTYENEPELRWRDREQLIDEGFVKDPESGGAAIGGKKKNVKKRKLADELG